MPISPRIIPPLMYPILVIVGMTESFKTDDDAVLFERFELGDQQLEAITVIRKFERLNEYFAI